MIKAFLCDFDGTLVNKDILTYVSKIAGKEEESRKINEAFIQGKRKGLDGLIRRINFLEKVEIKDIYKKLEENDFLEAKAKDIFDYLRTEKIITILNSGNILPVLQYYKDKLNIDYIVASKPSMKNGLVGKIKKSDCIGSELKFKRMKIILDRLCINSNEVIAMGDSMADQAAFEYAKYSIAINPKGGVDKFADYSLNSLEEAFDIIKNIVNNKESVA